MARRAWRLANARAVACPIPLDGPVTSTDAPLSRNGTPHTLGARRAALTGAGPVPAPPVRWPLAGQLAALGALFRCRHPVSLAGICHELFGHVQLAP